MGIIRDDLRYEQGFTLIETIITIIVLAIAMGVLIPFIVSLRGSANPVLMQQAAILAQDRLEQIIADRRDRLTPRGFTYATTPANYPNETPVPGFPNFTRTVALACMTPADFNGGGTVPSPSCAISDGQSDYARITVTVGNTQAGNITAVGLLSNH